MRGGGTRRRLASQADDEGTLMDGHDGMSLPSNRAFVVQLSEGAAAGALSGRVEHVVSGRATHFESWERLAEFVVGVLLRAAASSGGNEIVRDVPTTVRTSRQATGSRRPWSSRTGRAT